MEELKAPIRYVMWEFKNNKSTTETAKKISRVNNGQSVRNWFLKFHSSDILLKDEPRRGLLSDLDQK